MSARDHHVAGQRPDWRGDYPAREPKLYTARDMERAVRGAVISAGALWIVGTVVVLLVFHALGVHAP